MTFLSTRQIKKSAKSHTCDYCQHRIEEGDSYKINTFKIDGEMRTFKECKICTDFLVDNYSLVYGHLDEAYFNSFMECEEYVKFRKEKILLLSSPLD